MTRRELAMRLRMQSTNEARLQRAARRVLAPVARRLDDSNEDAMLASVEAREAVAREEMRAVLAVHLRAAALQFGRLTLSDLARYDRPKRTPLEEFEGETRRWIDRHSLLRAALVTETFFDAIRATIRRGFDRGFNARTVAEEIEATARGTLSASSAERIARTEAHTAASFGANRAAQASGLALRRLWISAEDARTRPSHVAAHGQTTTMGGVFIVGGSELRFPGDPNGPAREIINCRCVEGYAPYAS